MVLDLTVIFVVPLNTTPLIVLASSNLVALDAFPIIFPLNVLRLDIVIPATMLENPGIASDNAIVNSLEAHIDITESLIVNKITGYLLPSRASRVVDLARVVPNPSATSGPIKSHPSPFQILNVLRSLSYHNEPLAGSAGAAADNIAAPTIVQDVPV